MPERRGVHAVDGLKKPNRSSKCWQIQKQSKRTKKKKLSEKTRIVVERAKQDLRFRLQHQDGRTDELKIRSPRLRDAGDSQS